MKNEKLKTHVNRLKDKKNKEILTAIKSGLIYKEIGNKFGITISKVFKISRKNGVNKCSLNRNLRGYRNKVILKDIKDGFTYAKIGKKFGVTKARVHQIAIFNNIHRRETNRKVRVDKIKKIVRDIKLGASLSEITTKYRINRKDTLKLLISTKINNKTIVDYFRSKRDKAIVNYFLKKNTANQIINKVDGKLAEPVKITTISRVYQINAKHRIKRYPKIGNRHAGGSFDNKNTLKLIVKYHDKDNLSFREITEKLNKMKLKTVCGFKFQTQNVYYKYHSQLKKIKLEY